MDYTRVTTAAGARAKRDATLCNSANSKYGPYLQKFLGHVPKGLALGHLLLVNHELVDAPIRKDGRRGFMAISVEDALPLGISLDRADEPLMCAYLWGKALNLTSLSLFTKNSSVFRKTPDFWKCAYFNYWLGDSTFDKIWSLASPGPTDDFIWDKLVYAVKNLVDKRVGRWSAFELKMFTVLDCSYVFELWRLKGPSKIIGPGMEPVPTRADLEQLKLPRG